MLNFLWRFFHHFLECSLQLITCLRLVSLEYSWIWLICTWLQPTIIHAVFDFRNAHEQRENQRYYIISSAFMLAYCSIKFSIFIMHLTIPQMKWIKMLPILWSFFFSFSHGLIYIETEYAWRKQMIKSNCKRISSVAWAPTSLFQQFDMRCPFCVLSFYLSLSLPRSLFLCGKLR